MNDLTPNERCEMLVKRLNGTAGITLSFGYIGNCGAGYDDRCWMFFTNVKMPNDRNRFSFGRYSTKDLESLADQAEADLEVWLLTKVKTHVSNDMMIARKTADAFESGRKSISNYMRDELARDILKAIEEAKMEAARREFLTRDLG